MKRTLALWRYESDFTLQAIDYCTWAVTRKWERDDEYYYNLIKDKVETVYDLWSQGRQEYYRARTVRNPVRLGVCRARGSFVERGRVFSIGLRLSVNSASSGCAPCPSSHRLSAARRGDAVRFMVMARARANRTAAQAPPYTPERSAQ